MREDFKCFRIGLNYFKKLNYEWGKQRIMNEPEIKRRRKKSIRHEKSLISEFRFEILIGILFLFGVFLLFEQMEIKAIVFKGIVSFFQSITQGFSDFWVLCLRRLIFLKPLILLVHYSFLLHFCY